MIAAVLWIATAGTSALPAQTAYAIRRELDPKSGRGAIVVVGIDAGNLAALAQSDWNAARFQTLFSMTVATPAAADSQTPSIAGKYQVVGDVLRFQTLFPLRPGLKHRVVFRPDRLPRPDPHAREVVEEFTLAATAAPTAKTVVVEVYPTAPRVPANLLKIYLHFSGPMSRGEAYRRVRLLEGSGRPLEKPFLEIAEELWDATGTRLTLLLDPGRIKRGLVPHAEEGPVLSAGRSYVLIVDAGWPDADGRPLRSEFRRKFDVGPVDETQPDPLAWKVAAPAAETREPLAITFPEPLDHALLVDAIAVLDPDGRPVAGRAVIDKSERGRRFLPDRPWTAGTYRVVVDTTLEDLAGNSIARPFEVDESRPVGAGNTPEFKTITVVVAPSRSR